MTAIADFAIRGDSFYRSSHSDFRVEQLVARGAIGRGFSGKSDLVA